MSRTHSIRGCAACKYSPNVLAPAPTVPAQGGANHYPASWMDAHVDTTIKFEWPTVVIDAAVSDDGVVKDDPARALTGPGGGHAFNTGAGTCNLQRTHPSSASVQPTGGDDSTAALSHGLEALRDAIAVSTMAASDASIRGSVQLAAGIAAAQVAIGPHVRRGLEVGDGAHCAMNGATDEPPLFLATSPVTPNVRWHWEISRVAPCNAGLPTGSNGSVAS
jgi:hypothetical protein